VQFAGSATGILTFLLIGVLHVAVVKIEFHYGAKAWPIFALAGTAMALGSLFTSNVLLSVILGISGFMFAWSAPEIIKQKERVEKGWYPKKPDKT
jgi:hypothetical protein